MTESALHYAIELSRFLGSHFEAVDITEVVNCLLLELAHAEHDLVEGVAPMYYAIRFIEFDAVSRGLVHDRTLPMLPGQMSLVSRLCCFFGMDDRL